MIIRPISTGEYQQGREQYAPLIARALEYSHRPEDSVGVVEARIKTLDAFPVVIEEDDQLVALGVVELVETKDGAMWNVWTMAGSRMSEWVGDFLDWLEGVAGNGMNPAVGVMMGGRPGWLKPLRRLGYDVQSVILKKRVEQCHLAEARKKAAAAQIAVR